MRHVVVRNLTIGGGIPKVCVPMSGKDGNDILCQAERIVRSDPDIIEWRADFFDGILDDTLRNDILGILRDMLRDIPLIFTFRTVREGGSGIISRTEYYGLVEKIAMNNRVDIVDIEASCHIMDETDKYGTGNVGTNIKETDINRTGKDGTDKDGTGNVGDLVKKVKDAEKKVILSYHDFTGTPDRRSLEARMLLMRGLGADVVKVAVTPKDMKDVLELLAITEEMSQNMDVPIITMSMGRLGIISRLLGEVFGSAVTFASVTGTSAPGQIGIGDTRDMLEMVHRYYS